MEQKNAPEMSIHLNSGAKLLTYNEKSEFNELQLIRNN